MGSARTSPPPVIERPCFIPLASVKATHGWAQAELDPHLDALGADRMPDVDLTVAASSMTTSSAPV